jgi:alanine racemase
VTTLTIDLDAIAANWRLLAARHGARAACVVKADAYGMGAAAVASRLYAEGARHFFVATLGEGLALRPHLPAAMIAILDGLITEAAGLYAAHRLAPVLGNEAEIAAWSAHAKRLGRPLPALIHIDSGMNRLGLSPAALTRLSDNPRDLEGIDILYVMTHLANAEVADDPRNLQQVARFDAACALLPPAPRSLANSSGIFLGPAFTSDLARPGAALYGINPTPGQPNPMHPVMRLTARVLQLRRIDEGDAVGYNAIWRAARPTLVATVAAGYADGYHRALSNKAFAAFDGARLPLIGRVSMDLTTLDATDCAALAQGDSIELIGPAIPPDEVAAWAGTNGYEVLTSLRSRGERIYGRL